MRYNVADLLMRPTGTSRTVDIDDRLDVDVDGMALVAPVTGRLRLVRDHAGILVQGQLSTEVELECARCLAPARVPVAFELVEHFRPTIDLPEGPPILRDPDEEDEAATEIDAHHVLDLSAVIEQTLVLNLPLHALCRPDCKGLCPTCGHDLNDGPCGCRGDTDPRWDALRALLAEPSGPEGSDR